MNNVMTLIWNMFVYGGTGVAVFGYDASPAWFILAVLLCMRITRVK